MSAPPGHHEGIEGYYNQKETARGEKRAQLPWAALQAHNRE